MIKKPRILAAVLALVALPALGVPQAAGRERHRVEIQGFAFVPERLVVAPGDTVVWVNRDLAPHTVTAEDARWDSQRLEADIAWELHITEEMAGDYFCRYHPGMRGQLHVRRR